MREYTVPVVIHPGKQVYKVNPIIKCEIPRHKNTPGIFEIPGVLVWNLI
jgi:hypothetical protein